MNLFRVRGILLQVHVSFFLLLAYVAQHGWMDERWPGLLWSSLTLITFFACVVLHELGHSFTAMRFGIGVRRILLMPIGGMAEMDDIPRRPSRELLITLAGPAVNFVLAGVLWFWVRRIDDDAQLYSLDGLVYQLFWANLAMGCFNLQPVFPMDGGRILRALLATRLPYLRATAWAVKIGKVLAIAGACVALFARQLHLSDDGPIWMLLALYVFIFFVGELEYRAVRRREIDDAHWRAMLARSYPIPPPAEEPPVLAP
ncbi:MAG TPA: site-2 protease family protein [Opitutaceae bacterium]|nr:site-2 protease family protein [Opitutaceae bacterium]